MSYVMGENEESGNRRKAADSIEKAIAYRGRMKGRVFDQVPRPFSLLETCSMSSSLLHRNQPGDI